MIRRVPPAHIAHSPALRLPEQGSATSVTGGTQMQSQAFTGCSQAARVAGGASHDGQ